MAYYYIVPILLQIYGFSQWAVESHVLHENMLFLRQMISWKRCYKKMLHVYINIGKYSYGGIAHTPGGGPACLIR